MLCEALKAEEEEAAKKLAAEKQANQPVPAAAGKKADPKAAAKKPDPKGKGVAVADDPNSPKDITIEYPEVPLLQDYVIIDRNYRTMRDTINPPPKPTKPDPNVDKKALRLQYLKDTYSIMRALPMTCVTLVKLNYVEPPKPVVREVEVTPQVVAPAKGAPKKK